MGILKNFFAIRGRYRKNYDDYDRKGKSSRIATIVAMSIFPLITLLCVYFTCVLFTKGGEENTVYAIMLGILTVGLFVSSLEYSLMHTIIGFRSAVSSKIIDRIEDKVDENKTQTKLEIVDGKIVQKEVKLTEAELEKQKENNPQSKNYRKLDIAVGILGIVMAGVLVLGTAAILGIYFTNWAG